MTKAGFIYNEDYDYVQSVPGDYYGNRYNEFNTPYETMYGSKRYHMVVSSASN